MATALFAASSSSYCSCSRSSRAVTPTLRTRSRTVRLSKQHICRSTPTEGSGAIAAASATTAALLDWMRGSGCEVQGVELQYSQAADGQVYRELTASKDLSPGEVLVSVPLSCTLHYKEEDITQAAAAAANVISSSSSSSNGDGGSSSSSSSRVSALRRLQCRVPASSDGSHGAWHFKMALQVLFQSMDPSSPLQPYIQTLPGTCPGIPTPQVAMLWPSQQLQECQSGQLTADASSQAYWMEAYSRDVLAALPGSSDDAFGGQEVTQERLGWALAVSMSRAFGFKKLGGYALTPLVDMANHSPVSNAEVRYSADTARVNLIANQKVPAGAPILINYGSHDNANLLLSYGFVVPDNAADRFRVQLDMDTLLTAILQFVGGELPPTGRATDSLKQWQRTTLQQLGLLPGPTAAGAAAAAAAAAGAAPSSPPGSSAADTAADQGSMSAAGVPAVADRLQEGQQQQQQQQSFCVAIGGQPPVSGALLAAVRVVLAQDRAAVKSKSLEQLGDWQQPLTTQHEGLVMKALVGLCTVLYKSLPTSIQQDKADLTSLQQQGQPQQMADKQNKNKGQKQQEQQQQQQVGTVWQERAMTAVQFRLAQKLLLERSTKQLIQRLQELTALCNT